MTTAPTPQPKLQTDQGQRPELAPAPYREAERPSPPLSVVSKLEEMAPSGLCDPASVKAF